MSIIKCVAAGALGYIVGGVVGSVAGAVAGTIVNAAQDGCGVSEETQDSTYAACTGTFGYAGAIYGAIKAVQSVMDND